MFPVKTNVFTTKFQSHPTMSISSGNLLKNICPLKRDSFTSGFSLNFGITRLPAVATHLLTMFVARKILFVYCMCCTIYTLWKHTVRIWEHTFNFEYCLRWDVLRNLFYVCVLATPALGIRSARKIVTRLLWYVWQKFDTVIDMINKVFTVSYFNCTTVLIKT